MKRIIMLSMFAVLCLALLVGCGAFRKQDGGGDPNTLRLNL
jgi:hypothetical protein